MPIVIAILGAVATGLFYWLIWGNGLQYLEQAFRGSADRRRKALGHARTLEIERMTPLRSITDPRDGAAVMMVVVATTRGVLTPEQIAVIEQEMRDVLGFADEVPGRFAYARFAGEQAVSPEAAITDLAPLFRDKLTRDETGDLLGMLTRVAAVHGGPTEPQADALAFAGRRLELPA